MLFESLGKKEKSDELNGLKDSLEMLKGVNVESEKSKEELLSDTSLEPKNGDTASVVYNLGDYDKCSKKERAYSITAICKEYLSTKKIELTEGQYKDILDRLDKLEKSVKDLDFDDSEYCHMSHELRKRVEKLEKCNRIAEVKEHIEERQRND